MEREKGRLIVFEGIDGSGKSTQLVRFFEYLQKKNKHEDILRTHEPWNSEEIDRRLNEDKDAYSNAEMMTKLYISDRISHLNDLIIPALEKSVFVLCDRYSMSTCAYQWTQGMDLHKLISTQKDEGILAPHLTFFIDVSADIAQGRISKERGSLEKFDEWEFQEKLIGSYHSLIKLANQGESLFGPIAEINGRGSIDEVAGRIIHSYEHFEPKLKDQHQKS